MRLPPPPRFKGAGLTTSRLGPGASTPGPAHRLRPLLHRAYGPEELIHRSLEFRIRHGRASRLSSPQLGRVFAEPRALALRPQPRPPPKVIGEGRVFATFP